MKSYQEFNLMMGNSTILQRKQTATSASQIHDTHLHPSFQARDTPSSAPHTNPKTSLQDPSNPPPSSSSSQGYPSSDLNAVSPTELHSSLHPPASPRYKNQSITPYTRPFSAHA